MNGFLLGFYEVAVRTRNYRGVDKITSCLVEITNSIHLVCNKEEFASIFVKHIF